MSFYCPAVDGLYLRANGSVVCWNSPGEDIPLATIELDRLDEFDVVKDVLNGQTFRRMRRELHEHHDPFDFCQGCAWGCPQEDDQWSRIRLDTFELQSVRTFQVEPSFLCNLDCVSCLPIEDRKAGPPPHNLPLPVFRKVVDDLMRHEMPVELVQYSGFGEPQMSPVLPELVRHAKRRLRCPSVCDTNANFEFNEEILHCGLDELKLAMDGSNQESYVRYRRRGRFDRVLRFAKDCCSAKRRTGRSDTRIIWKTVLFEWNSSDDELREICRMANDIGVDEILFANTTTPGGISHAYRSDRWHAIRDLVQEELAPNSQVPVNVLDPECFAGENSRCHGFLESIFDRGESLDLRGWVLLDDGPPDEIRVFSREEKSVRARLVRRDDLTAAHPTIPRAEGGGFSVTLPAEWYANGGSYAMLVRLFRGQTERVRFSVRVARGAMSSRPDPIRLKHRKAIEVG
jgi:wyosine [tRNA(Phe)-imidazoG37] synthetase (radical SAM superfamily)